ncbi:hypothetical protein SAMN04487859_102221 [Roseovarius lutimaris]|uniref:Uncharacterized protein n=1 Tax=Roseovarius lutimaris TaxID=1005928 RepID=A0A1I4Z254_9RHOB|nr:hypothetical protein [Roseovarius lutimaris]SFN44059.1 hypothetical protein SAMN04487859_102221 [Roseovarius lutimaris]
MRDTDQTITFDQMKGTIGSLVFLWSGIEQSLNESIENLHTEKKSKSVHGISRSIDVWSLAVKQTDNTSTLRTDLCDRLVRMLKEALVIRNLVCHGLTGISVRLHIDYPEAHLKVQLGEDTRLLTWKQLDEMFSWMSRSRWLIRDLTEAAMENDAQRAHNRLIRWEKFPEQQ